jgi:excisionase family DNA binding protein
MTGQTGDLGFREVDWVSEQLGLDKNTVYRYLNDGRLPGLQLGKKWLVEEQALRDFLRREQRLQTERRQAAGWSEAGLGEGDPWSGTVTVVFSDLAGASAIVDRLDDDAWLDLIHAHNRILHEQLPAGVHSEVKGLGDGFMVAFTSATDAARFGVDFMRALADYNAAHADLPLRAHMGMHAGEVKHEAGDFAGKTVFIAALLGSQASPGEILVSSVVKDLVEDPRISFDDGREVELKVGGPRRVHRVLWQNGMALP